MTDWDKEIEEIEQRKRLSREQGGAENVAKHHQKGRLTIRERINHLVDSGTFTEHGPGAGFAEKNEAGEIASFTPANYVVGFGDVAGRRIVVGGRTLPWGGSPNAAGLRKSVYAEELAVHFQVPLVRFLEEVEEEASLAIGQRPENGGRPPIRRASFQNHCRRAGRCAGCLSSARPGSRFPSGSTCCLAFLCHG